MIHGEGVLAYLQKTGRGLDLPLENACKAACALLSHPSKKNKTITTFANLLFPERKMQA
jgi:hypothetical protein